MSHKIYNRFSLAGLVMLASLMAGPVSGQPWELARDREGIRVYTRQEPGKELRSFRGMIDMKAPAEKIFSVVEDVNHHEWWDASLSEIKVLEYKKNQMARYYLVYDCPWPVSDRDICVNVTVTCDTVRRVYTVAAVAEPWMLPPADGRVRIRQYRQSWRIEATGDQTSHVVLEGYADPAGSIPAWLSNLVIADTPYNVINHVRRIVEKP
jgi:hypothetical protein